MPFDSLVFDLDGTLWDTCEPCAMAWNKVLFEAGIPYRTILAEDVRAVTGKPHEECIRITFSNLTESQIMHLSEATMTEDNRMIDAMGGVLYDGVPEGLIQLATTYKLFIVSNCQSGYIETFLRLNQFEQLFKDVECWGNTGRDKSANLQSIIDRNHLHSPIMIGDADGDETAARTCEVPFAFVEYGFGMAKSPDLNFLSFRELTNYFLVN